MPGHPRQHDRIYHAKTKATKQPLVHCLNSRSFCSFCVATPTESDTLSSRTSYVFIHLYHYVLFSSLLCQPSLQEERTLIRYMAPVNDFADEF